MSRKATDWAWDQQVKPATLKLILLSLADRADEYHCCYPSMARVVKDTGLNRKTVLSGIQKLIDNGYLVDTGKRKGRTNSVRVLQIIVERSGANFGTAIEKKVVPKTGQLSGTKNGIAQELSGTDFGHKVVPKTGQLSGTDFGTQNQSLRTSQLTIKNISGSSADKPLSKEDLILADFEVIKSCYPKREGANPWTGKQSALASYRARIKEGHTFNEIHAGVIRYFNFIRAKGDLGTSFVMQAKRFLGTEKAFLQSWEISHATRQQPKPNIGDDSEDWWHETDSGGHEPGEQAVQPIEGDFSRVENGV